MQQPGTLHLCNLFKTSYAVEVRKNRIGIGAARRGDGCYLFRCGPPKTGLDAGYLPDQTLVEARVLISSSLLPTRAETGDPGSSFSKNRNKTTQKTPLLQLAHTKEGAVEPQIPAPASTLISSPSLLPHVPVANRGQVSKVLHQFGTTIAR